MPSENLENTISESKASFKNASMFASQLKFLELKQDFNFEIRIKIQLS